MANSSDPFLTAEADILSAITSTRSLLESYIRIRRTSPSQTSPELLSARADLTSALEDLTSDLQDLVGSVKAVEGDPYKYGLDVPEVERRRRLVAELGKEIEGMRTETVKTTAATGATSQNGALPDPQSFEDEDGGDNYAAFEQQRQQEMLHEQDEQLEGVFRTVGNLRMQADEMGRELEEQGELLDSVDTLTDRVGGKLQDGIKKVGWVIRENEETASSCCIAVLITVLIILLILVLVL